LQHFIGTYGYFAIFILMVAESACIPIPSELTMPLGGALAAGAVPGIHLSLTLVIAVGVAGNLVGSYFAWAVGRYGGQSAGRRWGRLHSGGLERAQRWFDRYGGRAVFIGRLLPAVRTFISLPAGFARMQPLRFGLYTVAGCVPWITGLAWAGWAAGGNWHHVTALVQDAGYVAGGLVGLLLIAAIIFWVRARRRRRTGVPPADRTSDPGRPSGSGPGAPVPAAHAAQQRRAS
jgi:membrane protein DedA with SNARE-associated domain